MILTNTDFRQNHCAVILTDVHRRQNHCVRLSTHCRMPLSAYSLAVHIKGASARQPKLPSSKWPKTMFFGPHVEPERSSTETIDLGH